MTDCEQLYGVSSYPTNDSSAKVVAVEGHEVALDATVFFPGGSGQIPDRSIMSWNDRQKEGKVIAMDKRDEADWHTLDCLPPPLTTEVASQRLKKCVLSK